jgi:hypothetical protein
MIITIFAAPEKNFSKWKELAKFVVFLKKWNESRKIFWKSFYFLEE